MLTYHQTIERENKHLYLKLLKEKQRRRGIKDLHYLCKNILGYQDLTDVDEFHGDYCRFLNREDRFKLTLTPRGSLKSSIGTIGGSIQDIIRDPNVRILLASEKFTNSKAFLTEIKGHFEKNEKFRRIYGDLVGDKWNENDIIVKTRTKYRASPTIACAGIDVTKVGMHYDIIRVDDPHSDQNTGNQDQIDKVIRWYKLLLSLLDPGGLLYITGTIWHYGDLYNHIINKEQERAEAGRNKKFVIFKRKSFKGTIDDLLNDRIPKKKYLWPQRLSGEFLRDQYIEQGPYIFNCQYQLTPVDDDNAVFKRSWIRTCDYSEVPKNLSYFSAVDPMRDEEGKDYLAIVTGGMDEHWRFYILDVRRLKADEHITVDEMYDVYKTYNPERMGFETVAFQKSYLKYIQLLQIMNGFRFPIVQMKPDSNKTKPMRIKSMIPYWKAGLFIIPCPKGKLERLKGGMKVLVDELLRYPRTSNDDCVDALAYINQLTHRPNVLHIVKKIPAGSFHALRKRYKGSDSKKKRLGHYNRREPAWQNV